MSYLTQINKKLKAIASVCRLNELLLVVPYAGTAAFLVSNGIPDIKKLFFLLLAVSCGFSVGNIFNAFIDRDIDAENPRTNQRPLVKRELSDKEIVGLIIICGAGILVGTASLSPFYVFMLPIPIVICFGYSFCKRFSWLGHFVLGVAHAICPVAGWVVFGTWKDWRAILFGAVIFFWTLSLDMIYSLQDMEYDINMNLHSIPAVFSKRVAYIVSSISHLIMLFLYSILICALNCGLVFIIGIALAECLIVTQYILIFLNKKNGKYALNLNQGFTLVIFISSILDKL